jgi:alanyl-tRNA synthetase
MTELLVTYPAGSTAESTAVVAMTRTAEGGVLFAVRRTPCHPLSPRWPDQPADRCTLAMDGARAPVECLEGFLVGDELRMPPATDEELSIPEDAVPCVVHRAPPEMEMAVGDKVSLHVDERYRGAVSCSHSRCHLVSLALNAALADAWRKEPPARDSLGSPDFDKLAIASSTIGEEGSLDVYRLGRHVRKSGFAAEALGDAEGLAERVSGIAKGWLQSSPTIAVTPGECPLQERRTWSCGLPQGVASFPCGGTHPSHMEPDEGLAVEIAWDPQERRLEMEAKGSLFHL